MILHAERAREIFNRKPCPPIKSRVEQVILVEVLNKITARSLKCYCRKKSLILVGQVKTTINISIRSHNI